MLNKTWRTLIGNFLIAAIIEFGICLVISFLVNDSNEVGYAFLILLAFWLLQIGIGMKNLIAKIIFHYAVNRRRMIDGIEEQLHNLQMPVFPNMTSDAQEYLNIVAEQEDVTRDQLVYAASSVGQFDILKQLRPSSFWMLVSSFETALAQYRRQVIRNRPKRAQFRQPAGD